MKNCKNVLNVHMKNHPEWVELWEKGQRPQGKYEEFAGNNKWRRVSVELEDALSYLMLDEYANEIEATQGKRTLQFEHIKEELRYPWLDLRLSMQKLTDKDLFSIITGESDQTLYVGLKVGCHITDVKDHYNPNNGRRFQTAFVRTDNGLKGSISGYEVLDERIDEERFNLQDHLQVNGRDSERQTMVYEYICLSIINSMVHLKCRVYLLCLYMSACLPACFSFFLSACYAYTYILLISPLSWRVCTNCSALLRCCCLCLLCVLIVWIIGSL